MADTIGRYVILRPLGRGAMGVVYLAKDPQIDRTIALKTIRFDSPGSSINIDEAKARFLKEARISGRLQHPNIVTVYDVGEDQGNLFLAMEFVSGGSLSQRLVDLQSLAVSERLRIVSEVADALAHAHERGVIHRDIKPANILLTDAVSAKVTDFGIGKFLAGDTELTSTGQMVGSPAYMSPEQIKGEKLDVRSDIFSLGVVLYQVLTARKPFPADTLTTLVYQILHEEPADPLKIRGDLPPDIPAVLRRCLAKNREDRYRDAGQLADDLRGMLGISPLVSTATLTQSRARRARLEAQSMAASQTAPTTPVDQLPTQPIVRTPPKLAPTADEPTVVVRSGTPPAPTIPSADASGSRRPTPAVLAMAAASVLALALLAVLLRTGGSGLVPSGGAKAGASGTPTPVLGSAGTTGSGSTPAVPVTDGAATSETRTAEPGTPDETVVEEVPTETPTPVVLLSGGFGIKATKTPKKKTTPTPSPTIPIAPEPTAAPPPARAADYESRVRHAVKVNVSPSQARVFLDGNYIGVSDDWDGAGGGCLLSFDSVGRRRLKLAFPGMRDLYVDVIVSTDATKDETELDMKLQRGEPGGSTGPEGRIKSPDYRTGGAVRFAVEPATTEVSVDGAAAVPITRFASEDLLLRGPRVHDVVLLAPGHESRILRVISAPGCARPMVEVKEKLKKK